MARPSKYNKKLQEAADHYAENHEQYGDLVPSIVGLADALSISKDTIRDWSNHKNKPEFSATLEKINNRQHKITLNKGLSGEFKSPIAKLLLHNHGYSDKVESDQSGSVEIKVTYEE